MSKNETMSVSSTGAQKGENLERYDLIPAEALRALAEHYGRGAKKYADRNWELGYEWHKSFSALNRHLWAFWNGEDIDEETGSRHITAVQWHATALATFMDTHPEFDDRPRPPQVKDEGPQKVLYISGPMTGYLDFNHPAFHAAASHYRQRGYTVINPAELDGDDTGQPWDHYLRRDLAELTKATHIVLLAGWSRSKGATLELHVAKALGMEVVYNVGAETSTEQ